MATILISAEDPSRRRYLATNLELKGHKALEASSDAQALEMIHVMSPDLLLIDVMMPFRGGYQLVRRLRTEPGPSLPRVIFLAPPYMESEARLLAGACGISRLVTDGADANVLLAAVESALSEPPLQREKAQGADDGNDPLYPVVSSLYGQVAELKTTNAQLGRSVAIGTAQLEVARSALKREVVKRLRTEQEMMQKNQWLRAQPVRDPLTGLYNRSYLEESLAREESRSKRSGKPLGVMMIDIDHFKDCNDTFGPAVGDAVLRAVSRCMETLTRSEDILCRYGGEEFVLVMTNTAPEILRQRADILRSTMPKLRIEHDHRPIGPITVSIGLASYPYQGDSAPAVLHAADSALHQSGTPGFNRIVGVQ